MIKQVRKNTAILCIIISVMIIAPAPVNAQSFAIIAVVNGEAISNFALHDRINFLVKSSGLENTKEIRSQLTNQALQTMINEIVQRDAAKDIGISVTDKDIERAIIDLESKNNLEKGGFDLFLKQEGLSKESLLGQIKSQIFWKKIVARKINPAVNVSDYEIDDKMEQLLAVKNKVEVYISEIFLSSSDTKQKSDTLKLAEKLIKEINSDKASFSSIAKQFSAGNSAENGGIIGWVSESNLSKDILVAIKKTGEHSITAPIETNDGYRIIKIGNKRSSKSAISRDKVQQFLTMQKVDLESRRYMKDLRSKAFIEVRLK